MVYFKFPHSSVFFFTSMHATISPISTSFPNSPQTITMNFPNNSHLSRYNCSVAVQGTCQRLHQAFRPSPSQLKPAPCPRSLLQSHCSYRYDKTKYYCPGMLAADLPSSTERLPSSLLRIRALKQCRFCNPPLFPATFTCRELHAKPQTHVEFGGGEHPINNCTHARQGTESRAVNCLWCGQLQGQVRHLL